MNKVFFVILFSIAIIFAEVTISPTDTITIRNAIFENNFGDFIIKNSGTLTLENCTFKNNSLGSKNSDAIFSNDKIISPIINYGKLTLFNCRFENNYSWNTALTDSLKAQISAGAIANFGDLTLSKTEFSNNAYQKGYFTVIRDGFIEQFSYIGNDSIYNIGDVLVDNMLSFPKTVFEIELGVLENPVKSKAEILVKTDVLVSVEIAISDAIGGRVFLLSDNNVNGTKTFTWNLLNQAGKRVSSGTYLVRLVATDRIGNVSAKSFMLGVKD